MRENTGKIFGVVMTIASIYLFISLTIHSLELSLLTTCTVVTILSVIAWGVIHLKVENLISFRFIRAVNLWLLISLIFAALYGTIFHYSPNSFSLNEEWFDQQTLWELDSLDHGIKSDYQSYFAVGLVETAGTQVADYLELKHEIKPNSSLPTDTLFLGSNYALGYAWKSNWIGKTDVITGSTAREVHFPTPVFLYKNSIDDEWNEVHQLSGENEINGILRETTPEGITRKSRESRLRIKNHILDQLDAAHVLTKNGREMEIIDFLYLSFSISTTIGSVGIEPNTPLIKMLITFQSFMIVIFLGLLMEWVITERS